MMATLTSKELTALGETCRYFWARAPCGLRRVHKYAKEKLIRLAGEVQASRWRQFNWLQRLEIEETATRFDRPRSTEQAFTFLEEPDSCGLVRDIKLDAPGPRMLLSDLSTEDTPVLRWRLQLRGNNAVEFGVVPVDLQDLPKALHKCTPNKDEERATGFSSAITVGSLLPARLPIMKGSVVEVLVARGEVAFIVTNPDEGAEMVWQNNSTVSRPYK